MAKVRITLEDTGEKSVSFLTEIEGAEGGDIAATPAMSMAMATRAMFENGLLVEAAAAALAGVEEGEMPTTALLAHFKTRKGGS
ncbi:hypothetical protein [Phaeobacter phage MD18]|nr:hypothetical protein [Phaeobacter phage MD18]